MYMCMFQEASTTGGFQMASSNVFSIELSIHMLPSLPGPPTHIQCNHSYSAIFLFPFIIFCMEEAFVFLCKTKHKQTTEHVKLAEVHLFPLQKIITVQWLNYVTKCQTVNC